MLTKTSFVTDEVYDLLGVITGKPLAKLIEKVDQISEQVNKPRRDTSGHNEPVEGLEASGLAP